MPVSSALNRGRSHFQVSSTSFNFPNNQKKNKKNKHNFKILKITKKIQKAAQNKLARGNF